MSQQTDLLREITAAISSGAPDRIRIGSPRISGCTSRANPPCRWDMRAPAKMMEAGRQNRMRAAVQTPAKVEALDMIQEGDRVAVRSQVTATAPNGNPYFWALRLHGRL
jgi:hypothetical protein